MAVKPLPSATIVLDVDAPLATEDTRLEVNRCWAYVAPTVLRSHNTPDGQEPCNLARMLVRLGGRDYLNSAFEGADALWDDVMEHWLGNMFAKVGNNMQIYNRRQREEGGVQLHFDWLEVELGDGALDVRIRLDSNSSLPAQTAAMLTRVREAFNSGKLAQADAPIAFVQLPSNESYAAQSEAAAQARAEAQQLAKQQAQLQAEEEKRARQEAIAQAAENFTESPDLADDPQADEMKALEEELQQRYRLPEADFALDYALWGVNYQDGTVREYDSAAGTFTHKHEEHTHARG